MADVASFDWKSIGIVRTATALELPATPNGWSIGAETMDRNFTVFSEWSKYLPGLGARRASVQGGWARCEQKKGVYSWGWLDEIVHGMLKVGVTPWIELSYGNPAYSGGGDPTSSSPLPKEGEAKQAFLDWCKAVVGRYGPLGVSQWELWNEPVH